MKAMLSGVALAALVLGAFASNAEAQTYNRLVVFGDSLSDNGNLAGATGGAQPPVAVYPQGRFSDGKVFTDMLGFTPANFNGSVTGSINYAFGGARTGTEAGPPPGMRAQLGAYMAAGGRFGANDLVTVLGGANNIFQDIAGAGGSSNPTGAMATIARTAATDLTSIVGTIAGAGAGTVAVINMPRLSTTPQFRGTAGAPLADFGVTTLNSALLTGLAPIAAANPNTNIIYVDLFTGGDVLAANPAAYGITNATDRCLNGATVCSNPGSYFYYDNVHPTQKGHSLIAALVNDYIYYGTMGSRMAVLGETSWRHREDDLDLATRILSTRDGWGEGTRLTLAAIGNTTTVDARGAIAETSTEGYGLRLGIETGNEDMRFGLAGSVRQSEIDAGPVVADLDNFAIDVYGGWRSERAFVNVVLGGSQDDYNDVQRLTALAPLVHTSSTRGTSLGARAQAGMWFQNGNLGFSPRVGVSWVSSTVDGFFENGGAADYDFKERNLEAITGEVALRLEGGSERYRFYGELGWRDTLSDSSEAVQTGLVGNTAKVLGEEVDLPFGSQGLLAVGMEGKIGDKVNVEIGYNGRYGSEFTSHSGGVRFSIPF